jgi:hypothetical protein
VSAQASFDYLFAGIAVADLAAEVEWFSRLFGRPPDILPNGDEAMWAATPARGRSTSCAGPTAPGTAT